MDDLHAVVVGALTGMGLSYSMMVLFLSWTGDLDFELWVFLTLLAVAVTLVSIAGLWLMLQVVT